MKRFEYEDAIDRSGLPMVQRAVLRHVVRRAVNQGGDLGEAWPSIADIVQCTGAGRRTVIRAIQALRDGGWLAATGTRRQVTVYRCQIGTSAAVTPDQCHSGTGVNAAPVPQRHSTGARAARGGCQSGTGPVPERHTEAPQKHSLKHSEKHPSSPPPETAPSAAPLTEPLAPPGQASADQPPTPPKPDRPRQPDAWQRLVDGWNELAKANGGGHSTLQRSKGQGQKLKSRMRDHGEEAIAEVFRWYWTSQHDRAKFLRSKQMGLKTLLRPDNCEEYVGFARQPERWDASNARGAHVDRLRAGPQGEEAEEAEAAMARIRAMATFTDDGDAYGEAL